MLSSPVERCTISLYAPETSVSSKRIDGTDDAKCNCLMGVIVPIPTLFSTASTNSVSVSKMTSPSVFVVNTPTIPLSPSNTNAILFCPSMFVLVIYNTLLFF